MAQIKDLIVNGVGRFIGKLYASEFIGKLTGNADTATSATKATQDESGNNIKSSYASSISISNHTITLKNKNGTSLGTVTVPDSNTWRGIQNNLTSDSTTDSLSAAQGKVLKGLVDGKAASSHTHSTATWTNKTDDRNYYVAFSLESQFNYDPSNSFQYNPSTKTLKAGIFSGSLSGNASTATKLQTARTFIIGNTSRSFDGSGNVSWTLAEIGAAAASHTHSYLPLSGGTMTGAIKWTTTNSKTPYIGYCTNSSDGTFVMSTTGTTYSTGLAIGGNSGNLIYKGNRVLDASNYTSYCTPANIGAAQLAP